jgi:hypothetical protein
MTQEAWADKPEDEAAKAMHAVVTRVRSEQQWRYQDRLINATLYGTDAVRGFSDGGDMGDGDMDRGGGGPPNQLSLNIVRTMIGAATARIAARNPPKPTFITQNGTWGDQARAKQMDSAVNGVFYQQKAIRKAIRVFRSALIFGDAGCIVEPWAGQPRIRRCLPGEMLVDEREAYDGEPRRLYRRRYHDRQVLISAFPRLKKELEAAKYEQDDLREWGYDPCEDQLLVCEGWSLPSMPGKKDGRYLAVCDGIPLESFPWERDSFPHCRYVWDEPETGWYGTGLAYDLRGLQLDINDLLDRINDAQKTVAGFWAVERGSQVDPRAITDERDRIVLFNGTVPQYITPNAIPQQMYDHLWQLWAKAFEITGLSQLAATSQKPAGLSSGAALRAYRDDQSERFIDKSMAYADFIVDMGRCTVHTLRDLATAGEVIVRTVDRKEGVGKVNWREVDLDADAAELQILPSSGIPNTPAAALEFAEDMAKLQVFEPRQIARFLGNGIPDIESLVQRANATEELVEKMFARIADEGVLESPEPEMLLAEAITVAQTSYLDYRRRGLDEDKLELMSRWMAACSALLDAQKEKEMAAAAPPPPPGMPPGPPGPPGPPPPPMQ